MKEYIGAGSKLPLPMPIHRQPRIGSRPSQASPPMHLQPLFFFFFFHFFFKIRLCICCPNLSGMKS